MSDLRINSDNSTLTVEKTKVAHPKRYKVLLHNDDYTPMDFVVMILETIFDKDHENAVQIMLAVHQKGIGVCGIFTREIAEHKTAKVNSISKDHEYPLKCTMEPD